MFDTNIPLYSILLILSMISGLIVTYINTKSLNFRKEETVGLLMYISLGAIFGAKYYTLFTNYQKYKSAVEFSQIGLSSYGAVIGIILMLFLFSKQYKKHFKDLIYALLPAIPLMYGIGKIGCFLGGCCYGINYDGPFHVTYNYSLSAPKNMNLFPIQLFETIIFIIIFLYISKISKKEQNKNKVIGITFIICSIAKFLLEYLRMAHKILSLNQIVSIMFLIIGIVFYVKRRKRL